MDLHLIPGAVATPDEREAIDAAIAKSSAIGSQPSMLGHQPSGVSRSARHLLLPALHAAQGRVGWITEGALNHICERLSVPPAEAFGVASFYAMFSLRPRPPVVVHVCDDIACRVNGAETICRDLEQRVGKPGTPIGGGRAAWLRSPCLGQCERAPAALVQTAGRVESDWTMT